MKVVFSKPDRIEAELFRVPRLLHDGPQARAPIFATAWQR